MPHKKPLNLFLELVLFHEGHEIWAALHIVYGNRIIRMDVLQELFHCEIRTDIIFRNRNGMFYTAVICVVPRIHDRDSFCPADAPVHGVLGSVFDLQNCGISVAKLPECHIIV